MFLITIIPRPWSGKQRIREDDAILYLPNRRYTHQCARWNENKLLGSVNNISVLGPVGPYYITKFMWTLGFRFSETTAI